MAAAFEIEESITIGATTFEANPVQGTVQRTLIVESSGHGDFDDAAVEVAKQMAWMPALNRDRATPVWLMQEVTFAAGRPVVGVGTRLP